MFTPRQGLFSFPYWPASEEAGGAQGAGKGTWPGQLTQTGQRDIPYHVTSCLFYKWGKLADSWDHGSGTSWASVVWGLCAIVLCITWFVYYFLLLLLLLLLFAYFFCHIKLSLSNPEILPFFPDSLPHPTGWGQ